MRRPAWQFQCQLPKLHITYFLSLVLRRHLIPRQAALSTSCDPSDLTPEVGRRLARGVKANPYTEELTGTLSNGTRYDDWTFNGKVTGPFVRVRVGDEVTPHLTNDSASSKMHSVAIQAMLVPGGGLSATQTNSYASTSFISKATTPDLFVYHCANPMVAAFALAIK